jgi:hypothetical protein
MKLQNKSYIILLIFFFTSCGSKQHIIEYKDRIIKDTIIQTKTIKEVERFTDTLTIKKPCDSLGNLRPFKQLIKVKQGSILIESKNDNITANIDLNGYKNTLEKVYKSKYDKFTREYNKTTVKYKTPTYHWIIHILCGLIIISLLRIR